MHGEGDVIGERAAELIAGDVTLVYGPVICPRGYYRLHHTHPATLEATVRLVGDVHALPWLCAQSVVGQNLMPVPRDPRPRVAPHHATVEGAPLPRPQHLARPVAGDDGGVGGVCKRKEVKKKRTRITRKRGKTRSKEKE